MAAFLVVSLNTKEFVSNIYSMYDLVSSILFTLQLELRIFAEKEVYRMPIKINVHQNTNTCSFIVSLRKLKSLR